MVIALGLGILALCLQLDVSHMKFGDFFTGTLDSAIPNKKKFGFWINVFTPCISYIIGVFVLAWMMVTNFFPSVPAESDMGAIVVKLVFIIIQLLLITLLVYWGWKLVLYWGFFVFLGLALVSFGSEHNHRKEY